MFVLCLCVCVHVPFERQSWEMVCSDNFLSYKTQMSKSTVKLWIFFLIFNVIGFQRIYISGLHAFKFQCDIKYKKTMF